MNVAQEHPIGMPNRFRRAFCELSGGHHFVDETAKDNERITHFRLRCMRCNALTRWRALAEPRKLKISYLVAGEEGVVATGFKSEKDAKLYADSLNAGKFPTMPEKDKP